MSPSGQDTNPTYCCTQYGKASVATERAAVGGKLQSGGFSIFNQDPRPRAWLGSRRVDLNLTIGTEPTINRRCKRGYHPLSTPFLELPLTKNASARRHPPFDRSQDEHLARYQDVNR
jgi:hypothetical protein